MRAPSSGSLLEIASGAATSVNLESQQQLAASQLQLHGYIQKLLLLQQNALLSQSSMAQSSLGNYGTTGIAGFDQGGQGVEPLRQQAGVSTSVGTEDLKVTSQPLLSTAQAYEVPIQQSSLPQADSASGKHSQLPSTRPQLQKPPLQCLPRSVAPSQGLSHTAAIAVSGRQPARDAKVRPSHMNDRRVGAQRNSSAEELLLVKR